MKNLIKKLITSGLTAIVFFGFASNVFATNLDVQFTPNPLFNETNFLPNDVTEGTVVVKNNNTTGDPKTILTEAINIFDNDNYGSLLHLKIVGSSGTLFDNTLANFLSTAGEVSLGSIGNGEEKTFTYTVSFINSSDNSYQGKTLGFDVCVGFSGGTQHCGDTVIGGENDTGGGGNTGGGGSIPGSGGGGGGGSIILTISSEQAEAMLDGTTITITWNTNKLSTSQVVYGLLSGAPYTLDVVDPIVPLGSFFGYPLGTAEDPTKVLHHSVLITGLELGQTYLYRVVSRASPPTVSPEHQFTVPLLLAQTPNDNFTAGNQPGISNGEEGDSSAGLGTSAGTSGEDSGNGVVLAEENAIDSNNNLLSANALFSGFGSLISNNILIFILLILLILYIIWRFWLRKIT